MRRLRGPLRCPRGYPLKCQQGYRLLSLLKCPQFSPHSSPRNSRLWCLRLLRQSTLLQCLRLRLRMSLRLRPQCGPRTCPQRFRQRPLSPRMCQRRRLHISQQRYRHQLRRSIQQKRRRRCQQRGPHRSPHHRRLMNPRSCPLLSPPRGLRLLPRKSRASIQPMHQPAPQPAIRHTCHRPLPLSTLRRTLLGCQPKPRRISQPSCRLLSARLHPLSTRRSCLRSSRRCCLPRRHQCSRRHTRPQCSPRPRQLRRRRSSRRWMPSILSQRQSTRPFRPRWLLVSL